MKVVVVQNAVLGDIGVFGHSLERRYGASVAVVRPQEQSLDDLSPDAADLFVILGSPHSVYDEGVSWITQEIDLARRLLDAARPLVGICFGAQVLATALGGSVAPTGESHFGWMPNDEATDPVWNGPWFRFHGNAITLPAHVPVLARSGSIIQVFRHENAIGLQFHPEIYDTMAEQWVTASGEAIEGSGQEIAQVLDACLEGCRHAGPRTDDLIDEILKQLGFPAPVAA